MKTLQSNHVPPRTGNLVWLRGNAASSHPCRSSGSSYEEFPIPDGLVRSSRPTSTYVALATLGKKEPLKGASGSWLSRAKAHGTVLDQVSSTQGHHAQKQKKTTHTHKGSYAKLSKGTTVTVLYNKTQLRTLAHNLSTIRPTTWHLPYDPEPAVSGLENLTRLVVGSNPTHPTICHKNPEIHRTCLKLYSSQDVLMKAFEKELTQYPSVKIHKKPSLLWFFLFPLRG